MDFEALRVDRFPIDQDLTDIGTVGPACAHQFGQYLRSPRALVWRNPSSDWQLFMVLLPMPERLTLMRNPIFAQLVRDWGHELRVMGVDHEQRLFDFRKLLTPAVLHTLLDALSSQESTQTLDAVFAMLAGQMLTIFEQRRDDWPQHLARDKRLPVDSGQPYVQHDAPPDSLFDRRTRTREVFGELRAALKQEWIDVDHYSRALRSIDQREWLLEQRLSQVLQDALSSGIVAQLKQTPIGLHLGCYNWMLIDPRHASQRAYILSRLSCFAQVFSDHFTDPATAARSRLMQAVDSGQDRRVIDGLAEVFAVDANTIRGLWRAAPQQLGTPSFWRLQQLLLWLDVRPPHQWPQQQEQWAELAQTLFE